MTEENEKRNFKRIANEFNVRIAKEVDNEGFRDLSIDVAKAVNISASGILINITETIAIGEKIRITFLKPNTFEFFEGMGKVIRIEDNEDGTYKLGISFEHLNDAEKKRLDYYLNLL